MCDIVRCVTLEELLVLLSGSFLLNWFLNGVVSGDDEACSLSTVVVLSGLVVVEFGHALEFAGFKNHQFNFFSEILNLFVNGT